MLCHSQRNYWVGCSGVASHGRQGGHFVLWSLTFSEIPSSWGMRKVPRKVLKGWRWRCTTEVKNERCLLVACMFRVGSGDYLEAVRSGTCGLSVHEIVNHFKMLMVSFEFMSMWYVLVLGSCQSSWISWSPHNNFSHSQEMEGGDRCWVPCVHESARLNLSWVNVFCFVYTLVFLLSVILLCRPILEAMCIVVFQSSLSEYERFLPKLEFWPSLIIMSAFSEPFFFFCILRYTLLVATDPTVRHIRGALFTVSCCHLPSVSP